MKNLLPNTGMLAGGSCRACGMLHELLQRSALQHDRNLPASRFIWFFIKTSGAYLETQFDQLENPGVFRRFAPAFSGLFRCPNASVKEASECQKSDIALL